jgi:hypothetical protein
MTGLRSGRLGNRNSIPDRNIDFSSLYSVHSGFGTHPASCPLHKSGSSSKVSGWGRKGATCLNLVSRIRMLAAKPALDIHIHGMLLVHTEGQSCFHCIREMMTKSREI